MKKPHKIHLIILVLCHSIIIFGQSCFDKMLQEAQIEKETGHYELAIQKLQNSDCKLNAEQKIKIQNLQIEIYALHTTKLNEKIEKNEKILNSIYFYHNKLGLAAKEIDGKIKYGYINRQGDVVIDFLYDEAVLFDEDIPYAKVKKDKKYYYLDTLGREYLMAESVSELTRETEVLDLSRQGLKSLPDNIRVFTKLKIINLYDNDFYQLPPWLDELKHLEELYLGFNVFSEIPPVIFELKNLVKLDLYDNEIDLIPSAIQELKSLQELSLEYNPLEIIPIEIENLKQLKKIDLIGVPLEMETKKILQKRMPACKIIW